MNLVTKGQAKVGKLVVTLGAIDMSKQATAQILGGSTSFSIRNNANSADNIITTDAGAVTIRAGLTVTAGGATITAGALTFGAAASQVVPGATSFSIRDNGNASDNLIVTNAGSATVRAGLTVTAGGLTVTSGNLLVSAGTGTITSASANALAVGANGATNPALNVDASTGSSVTGINIKSAAAGGGVAVSVISSGGQANEGLTVNAKGAGTIQIGNTSTGQISIGRGLLATPFFSSSIGALGTAQNSTPSAAQLLGGVISQTGQTGAGTVTLPTGTQLSTAVTGVAVGDTFECTFANLGGGFNLTITGATGSTVIGNGVVPSGKNAYMEFVNTGANTWNVYVIVSA
jgi:fibronectin-binding autotransporter adhesin